MRECGVIGVVTGLRAEAQSLPPAAGLRIVCSGSNPQQARRLAVELIDRGARALLSFGLAGGLSPAVRPGDLLLPEAVVLPTGARLPTDREWCARLAARLSAVGLQVHRGALAGSDHLLATIAAKQELHAATGALAVDMESHAVAETAARAGLPFLVIRAVADPFDQTLPCAARAAIGPDGGVRLAEVARALLERPGELPALLRLGRQSGRALALLRRVALLAGPALDLG
jgi:adenosylhomocysteine nucleosidase